MIVMLTIIALSSEIRPGTTWYTNMWGMERTPYQQTC